MTPSFSLCVFCGSRFGEPVFIETARTVGRWIGEHGGQLVYGGGNNGLMGVMAEATLTAGGRVVGVIPHALVEKEWAKLDCTELHVVDTMHDRKRLMGERADAFLALPGGIGTLEEFFEVWTWRQLGYHDKPIGLLDADGYYADLLAFLRTSVSRGFMSASLMDLVRVHTDAGELLAELAAAARASVLPSVLTQI
ncbi:TIGR00730 family Rossman fold protein [Caenimonas koreensis]|uniref:Cytokinin riboside 5'-monophosphate phosphoribohydrolase n=1 Tax=Caenimonas koreensis DSM 17982 TaxID=1121255 RepID=A0A844AYA3_9BURK|nr:TIGR00730 family Rossman fold protein [Caenimonas koreensis]MRD45753.1 TIGR00730 family Rossman fold protein [Caenimonas koreensis DSM 17982]